MKVWVLEYNCSSYEMGDTRCDGVFATREGAIADVRIWYTEDLESGEALSEGAIIILAEMETNPAQDRFFDYDTDDGCWNLYETTVGG